MYTILAVPSNSLELFVFFVDNDNLYITTIPAKFLVVGELETNKQSIRINRINMINGCTM